MLGKNTMGLALTKSQFSFQKKKSNLILNAFDPYKYTSIYVCMYIFPKVLLLHWFPFNEITFLQKKKKNSGQ